MTLVRAIDTQIYHLQAIKQAATTFRSRCSIDVAVEKEGRAVVSISTADPVTVLEFWNYALECSLVDCDCL